ncbi:DNA binding protein vP5 [Microviridae sp.]|nr:DNA binding protein vP5 [Microviridae sp.]UOF78485.1 DNA binding protein vP5 [Microviridae sp.]
MYAVRDRASVSFANPMFIPSRGQAIRSFSDEVNRVEANNILNAHPEDFDLYYLGEFDTSTGLVQSVVPEQICVGKDVVLSRSN